MKGGLRKGFCRFLGSVAEWIVLVLDILAELPWVAFATEFPNAPRMGVLTYAVSLSCGVLMAVSVFAIVCLVVMGVCVVVYVHTAPILYVTGAFGLLLLVAYLRKVLDRVVKGGSSSNNGQK